MKMLITAFLPFNKSATNSSLEVVKRISIPNIDLLKEYLEVSYQQITGQIKELLLEHQPDILILCGEARGRSKITLEHTAINIKGASIPDNEQVSYEYESICENGQNAYFSKLSVYELVKKAKSDQYPVELSYTAGTYLCNMSYYVANKIIDDYHLHTKVIFIHFPLIGEMPIEGVPTLPLDKMVKTTEYLINRIMEE